MTSNFKNKIHVYRTVLAVTLRSKYENTFKKKKIN